MISRNLTLFILCLTISSLVLSAKPRARDLGIPFDGQSGPLNAITDVAGVAVGHTTIIEGEGLLRVGEGPVRTGVTAILPLGKKSLNTPVFAGIFVLNGNGEMTGAAWVEESGFLEGPVMITNTHSIGAVHEATIAWRVSQDGPDSTGYWWSLPVVAETWDGYLNDINGFHVKREHVFAALENARPGPVPEGNVGGGTGMVCYEFKGGIGTASRVLKKNRGGYTVGVLVQANFGRREELLIAGIPVGREIMKNLTKSRHDNMLPSDEGSAIIVIATDAPLLPHQLKRLARRATHGLARTGSATGNGSGDIFIAFSTAIPKFKLNGREIQTKFLYNENLDPLFTATVQATEEAIINALIAAQTMTGRDNHKVIALPHDELRKILQKHSRLNPKPI